jgi:hypothetical protein
MAKRKKSPVSIIATVALGAATIAAPYIAPATILGSTTLGAVATGAVLGTGGGAITSAISGGNVLKGALTGGLVGSIGAGIGAGVGDLFSPSAQQLGQAAYTMGPSFSGASSVAPGFAASTIPGAAKSIGQTTAGALLRGSNLGQALGAGALGAVPGAAGASLGFTVDQFAPGTDLGRVASGVGSQVVGTGIQDIFGEQRGSGTFGYAQPSGARTATNSTQTDVAPYALSQALRTAPDLGYSPGSAILGASGGDQEQSKNVWNIKSLRSDYGD